MKRAKELLAQATPLPWGIDYESPKTIVAHDGTGAFVMRLGDSRVFSYAVQMDKNVDLALYAVNRLPAYEAAVAALERLLDRPTYHAEDCYIHTPELRTCECGIQQDKLAARASLARLRDEVPA